MILLVECAWEAAVAVVCGVPALGGEEGNGETIVAPGAS